MISEILKHSAKTSTAVLIEITNFDTLYNYSEYSEIIEKSCLNCKFCSISFASSFCEKKINITDPFGVCDVFK